MIVMKLSWQGRLPILNETICKCPWKSMNHILLFRNSKKNRYLNSAKATDVREGQTLNLTSEECCSCDSLVHYSSIISRKKSVACPKQSLTTKLVVKVFTSLAELSGLVFWNRWENPLHTRTHTGIHTCVCM